MLKEKIRGDEEDRPRISGRKIHNWFIFLTLSSM